MGARALLGLLAAAAVLASPSARAGNPVRPALVDGVATSAPPPAAAQEAPSLCHLGIMADAGVPDGANGSLVVRPWSWLRVHAGGGSNTISHGVRVGLTLLPFGMGPSLSVEAGGYGAGDANGLVQRFVTDAGSNPALRRIGYEYANAHLGLDLGKERVVFFIHGGLTMLRTTSGDVQQAAPGSSGSADAAVDAALPAKLVTMSVKLGLIVYLF